MIIWHFPVIQGGNWRRVAYRCNRGNKYDALADYSKIQAAKGVTVQGHDMSQAWSEWL